MATIHAPTSPVARCATCRFYSAPGMLTAYCRHADGPPEWLDVPKRGSPRWPNWRPEMAYVRGDDTCPRWAAVCDERRAA